VKKKRQGAQPGNSNVDRAGFEPASGDPAPPRARDNTPQDQRLRKRGGQSGNQNALKHGFYSSIFKASERRLLAEMPITDLSAEIELIRVTSKRFLEALSASKGELDFETHLSALRLVNLSAHSIASLLRAQSLTALADPETLEALGALENLPPADASPSQS
jgi:hypothetical protein